MGCNEPILAPCLDTIVGEQAAHNSVLFGLQLRLSKPSLYRNPTHCSPDCSSPFGKATCHVCHGVGACFCHSFSSTLDTCDTGYPNHYHSWCCGPLTGTDRAALRWDPWSNGITRWLLAWGGSSSLVSVSSIPSCFPHQVTGGK